MCNSELIIGVSKSRNHDESDPVFGNGSLQFYKRNLQLNPYPSLKKVFTISSQLQSCEVWRPETEQWEALDIRLRESHNNAMLWTDPAGTIWLIGTVRS